MRTRKQAFAAVIATALVAGTPVAAQQPVQPKPDGTMAHRSENCVAVQSSQAIHNGSAVNEQARAAPGARAAIVHAALAESCP